MNLVLASSSPRRRELLASIGIIPDEILSPDVDETPLKDEAIRSYVKRIALLKARTIHSLVSDSYVLSADTAVYARHKIILKASTAEEAFDLLKKLSGRRHNVLTGVCAISPEGREACRVATTKITFKRLSDTEIKKYIAAGEWQGKAGAYSIQNRAAAFVKNINGSYSNVVGLPLYETDCLLKGLGYHGN